MFKTCGEACVLGVGVLWEVFAGSLDCVQKRLFYSVFNNLFPVFCTHALFVFQSVGLVLYTQSTWFITKKAI